MMKKLFLSLALALMAFGASAQVERPKLVVGLVVDQMRWDYLYYYYDKFERGGLRRLVDEGFNCENNLINYVPTVTGIGHASIYTGSTPALHSIAGNDFYMDGRFTYCCSDHSVKSVGGEGRAGEMSPRKMTATTIGDMLKVATDFRSKVIGVAMKDRAAILPAGHGADAAYWWDNAQGHYITSTYYMQDLPEWVKKFNQENTWNPGKDIKMSPDGVTKTFLMAQAAIENERLGQRGECDMLCVSVSPTDAIAHSFGTRGKENYDVYMRLDHDLSQFLSYLDKKIGKGQYLLFLTADHGAAHNSTMLSEHRIAAGGWSIGDARKALNEHLKAKFPHIKIIVSTSMADADWLEKAQAAGIESFWFKTSSKLSLLEVMERTMAGESVYPEETPAVMLGDIPATELTKQQRTMLRLLIDGLSNREIAEKMHFSPNTIKDHMDALMLKTGIHSRTALVAQASRLGVVVSDNDRLEKKKD